MQGNYKFAVATPSIKIGDASANARQIAAVIQEAAADGVAAIAFPELSITGYTCGDLFFRRELLADAWANMDWLARWTSSLPIISVVGFPQLIGDSIFNAAAVICGGKIVDIIRKRALPTYGEYYEARQFTPASCDEPVKVFDAGVFRFGVEICEDLWTGIAPSSRMSALGVDVVFNPSASTDYLGKAAIRRDVVRGQSLRLGCAYAMACAGFGESGADAIFGGDSLIADCGKVVAESEAFSSNTQIIETTIDVESNRFRRRAHASVSWTNQNVAIIRATADFPEADPERVSPSPFLDEFGEKGWHRKVLDIQSAALMRRMESAKTDKLVVGVSGGADSSLALIGATKALGRSGLPAENLMAVVMPGFGSSEKTQHAAKLLAGALHATCRVIDIRDACQRHLADLGHPEHIHDTAYENAQARERTQILMDIANMENALVVGTGDLTEIALGWNTYNGDHMSMYQINASLPKMMVLSALKRISAESEEPIASLLAEIAGQPITPELLPEAAANDSEARLGPYVIHDFLLYHYLANGASPEKLLALANIAFKGIYNADTIEKTHQTFLQRFKAAQYKRNASPDGPKITLSLSPRSDWRMPSDI